jgi:hypothetical protein
MIMHKKVEASKLRQKNKSYNEISRILGISKSTLSDWFKNDKSSQKTKLVLSNWRNNPVVAARIKKLVKFNKKRWEKWREAARIKARKEFGQLSKNPLFIAGVMSYWAEGDSGVKNPVRFTNTDPRMVALYTRFIGGVLKIPTKNIRIGLILYPDLIEDECINFWSKITSVPREQFHKVQYIKGRHSTRRLEHGICMVTCLGRQLKEKILIWIDLLSKTV